MDSRNFSEAQPGRWRAPWRGVLCGALLAGLCAAVIAVPAVAVEAPDAPAAPEAPDRAALEAELEQARAELDAAAARLGELHRQLYTSETLGRHGRKPMLGVLLGERGPNGGILLAGVTPGGGAEAAGLKAGDELTAVNNVDLTGAARPVGALKDAVTSVAPGEPVAVTYHRNGSVMVADVTTQARGVYFMGMTGIPDIDIDIDVEKLTAMTDELTDVVVDRIQAIDFTAGTQWMENLESLESLEALKEVPAIVHRAIRVSGPAGGVRLEAVTHGLGRYFGVDSGVLVLNATPAGDGTPSLMAGDILLSVDGEPVTSVTEGYRALFGAANGDAGATMTVEVMRDRVRETLVLPRLETGVGHSGGIMIRGGDVDDVDVRVIPADPT